MLAQRLFVSMAATALFAGGIARAEDGKRIQIPTIIGSAKILPDSSEPATITGSATLTLTGDNTYTGGEPISAGTIAVENSDDDPIIITRSDYWLGIAGWRPLPVLVAQLNLPKDQGVVVEALDQDGPAAKAGVKQYDILLKGNDKPLKGLHDLYQLVDEVKTGKLKLDLIRAGKPESVTVTPAKRPANKVAVKGMNLIGPTTIGGGPVRFSVVGPGQILSPGGPAAIAIADGSPPLFLKSNLSDGSEAEITKKGTEPAKVVVTRDKEKWEATSDDLSKIPEKIRPEVEKLVNTTVKSNMFYATAGAAIAVPGPVFVAHGVVPGPIAISPDVEKRLGEMQKQIDDLRSQVEKLKGEKK